MGLIILPILILAVAFAFYPVMNAINQAVKNKRFILIAYGSAVFLVELLAVIFYWKSKFGVKIYGASAFIDVLVKPIIVQSIIALLLTAVAAASKRESLKTAATVVNVAITLWILTGVAPQLFGISSLWGAVAELFGMRFTN